MPKRKMSNSYSSKKRTTYGSSFRRRRKAFGRKYRAVRRPYRRRSVRNRRIKAALNPEALHATPVTNASLTTDENPTGRAFFPYSTTALIGSSGTTFSLKDQLSNIVQGDGQGNRDGNRINIKKWTLTLIVKQNKAEPLFVRMFIARPKANSLTSTSITNVSMQTLLQSGNSSNPPYTTILAYNQNVNTDYWTVKMQKKFMLSPCSQDGDSEGNDDFSLDNTARAHPQFRKFVIDLAKWAPRTIIYNDTTTAPRNCQNYFLFFQTCTLGSAANHTDAITLGSPYSLDVDILQQLSYYDV